MSRDIALVLIAAGALVLQGPVIAQAEQAQDEQAEERSRPFDVTAVAGMLEGGMAQGEIIAAVRADGRSLDLAPGDIARLERAGAAPELILALAGIRVTPREEGMEPGALTERRVLRMYGSGVAPATIVGLVARYGLSAPPAPRDLAGYLAEGIPSTIVRALADAGRGSRDGAPAPRLAGAIRAVPASALSTGSDGYSSENIIAFLEQGRSPQAIAAAINLRGLSEGATLGGLMEDLRAAGIEEETIAVIAMLGEPGTEAVPRGQQVRRTPTPETHDRLWVDSTPPGARVYISPRGTYREESFRQSHAVGKTPLSLQLEPGEYQVTVVKDAGPFEDSLLPAWRTMYDTPETRTILDNAHLVFDPDDCCLPTSLTGEVNISSIGRDQPRAIIGDQFGGLPPYLFDGESSLLLDVRGARIRSAIKTYKIRKNPGQSRMLVATFLPAEGDPLEPAWESGVGAERPYAGYLESPGLGFLTSSEGIEGCAALLGIDAGRLERAVDMLARSGKAIVDRPARNGRRMLSIALDDYGRLRLGDRTISPADLFSARQPSSGSPEAGKTEDLKVSPLPEVERVVVPGLGLPRLVVTNDSSHEAVLHFDDGQFFYVPAGASREVVIDPGTFEVRLLGGGVPPGSAAKGRLHFAYHARYSLSF